MLLLCFCIINFVGCDKDDTHANIVELLVASQKVTSEKNSGYLVRQNNTNWEGLHSDWIELYTDIVGFQYEEGYEYLLKVKEIVPPGVSSTPVSYELVKVLSKERKTTEFYHSSYTLSYDAYIEGEELSAKEIAEIKLKIKENSPFNGANELKLSIIDYDVYKSSKDRGLYTISPLNKTDHYSIQHIEENGKLVTLWSFEFSGKKYVYEYSKAVLLLDVTSEYHSDYPKIKVVQSKIALKAVR